MEKNKSRTSFSVYLRWIGWVLLAQFILINISAALYAYKLTHVYDDPALRNARPSKNVFVKTWRLFTGPRQARSFITEAPTFSYDTVQFKTKNGIKIDCWYGEADSAAKGTVILFHGLASNKGMVLPEANEFRYLGYNVLLVDFRAHGNSEGNTTTLGMKESEEVKLAYDFVMTRNPKNIFLWGNSMGAVVIGKAIADHALKPSGAIFEMPFASLQSHLQSKARALGFSGMPEKPFGFFVTCWIGIERGLGGFKHRTTRYMDKVNCPVLLQWGEEDRYVLKRETEKIFGSIASKSKTLVTYPGAGHESLLLLDPARWRQETEKFLAANTR